MNERSRYAEFIQEIYNQEPFPWQADLAEMLVAGEIPEVIDVPTGMGKTRLVATWVYAIARQKQLGKQRMIPLRLAFVVDRRLIVDSVYVEAELIRSKLSGTSEGVCGEVAEALDTGGDEDGSHQLLGVTRMRGGATWNSAWLMRPDVPSIVVSTVDQFGSRLLFRGYGSSNGRKPIDAALVGLDTWLVIDEAHLSDALISTAETVSLHQKELSSLPDRRLRVTSMSATAKGSNGVLAPDYEDQTNSIEFPLASQAARSRIEVEKPVALLELEYRTGSERAWRTTAKRMGVDLASIALEIGEESGVVGVICNTVTVARAVHSRLVKENQRAILLIGRCREHEREKLLEEWLPKIQAGSSCRPERLYVVATQTIEVGADLDFDAIVTEVAPLSSLAQRFGRVNRLGEREPRTSVVVFAPGAHSPDPVYGDVSEATWQYLSGAVSPTVVDSAGRLTEGVGELDMNQMVDLGIRPLKELRARAPEEVEPDSVFVPQLIGSHIERWAATSPMPLQDVDPAPFIRGVKRPSRTVSVLWRVSPPRSGDEDSEYLESWREWLVLQPPVAYETVEVPIGELRRFLRGDEASVMSDIDSAVVEERENTEVGDDRLGVVWRSSEGNPLTYPLSEIRPGDWVVIDADSGGHDEWGWTGLREGIVDDVGDMVHWRRQLRVDGRVLRTLVEEKYRDEVESRLFKLQHGDDGELVIPTVDDLFGSIKRLLPSSFMDRISKARVTNVEVGGEMFPLLVSVGQANSDRRLGDTLDGSEFGSSLTSSTGDLPTVYSHGLSVGRLAASYARNLGLSDEIVHAVRIAGEWHDLGKADQRFQAMLVGGDRLRAAALEDPLAKSGEDRMSRTAWRASKVPRGFRHEAVSARIADQLIAKGALPEGADPELVRHLVVSHHGHARPLLPPLVDEGASDVGVEVGGFNVNVEGASYQADWDQPRRFALLNERYGWWALALYEAIVRLADQNASSKGI